MKIKIDITSALRRPLRDLEYLETKILKIHNDLKKQSLAKKDSLAWITYPSNYDKETFLAMHNKAKEWKYNGVKKVVVIAAGGTYLGIRAGYEFIYSKYTNNEPDLELIFTSNDLSADELVYKLNLVSDTKFAILVISNSGNTIETLITFKEFHNLLTKKELENTNSYIIVVSQDNQGSLLQYAKKHNYKYFLVPKNSPSHYSILTPLGLFAFMCAGIDVAAMLKAATKMQEELDNLQATKNFAYLYAATRHYLNQEKAFAIEKLIYHEPRFKAFSLWWKQLVVNSEGKEGKGIWPSIEAYNDQKLENINNNTTLAFKTMLLCLNPLENLKLNSNHKEYDLLNYLDQQDQKIALNPSYDLVEYNYKSKHEDPIILIKFDAYDESSLGALFTFFHNAMLMSTYLLNLEPFEQPALDVYKNNILNTLTKTNK